MQNEITELRNQVRTLKRIVYGFGCLLIAGLAVGATSMQTVPDVIQAKKFQVVNDDGKVIVELSNQVGDGVDNGRLVTRNSAGQTLVELGSSEFEGVVITKNGKGQTLVLLSSSEFGGAVVTENGKGQTLVRLTSTVDGEGTVTTVNGKGQTLVLLTTSNDGEGAVLTYNGKGTITSTTP